MLLAADGVADAEIAERLGSSQPTVLNWHSQYAVFGIEALGELRETIRDGSAPWP
ncbi:helix-turn-helix domain-containing protein [Streptomyces sp. NPDC086082]|uniref:helix-turn-helix domain-containing protein n=1 Tax=Streptomyces sp. NPDC086082 TaxID=3365750 RepID=UPI00380ED93D